MFSLIWDHLFALAVSQAERIKNVWRSGVDVYEVNLLKWSTLLQPWIFFPNKIFKNNTGVEIVKAYRGFGPWNQLRGTFEQPPRTSTVFQRIFISPVVYYKWNEISLKNKWRSWRPPKFPLERISLEILCSQS